MSLFKLPLLLLSAISYHVALYSPTPPNSEDKIMGTSVLERIWAHAAIPCTAFVKSVTWAAALAESMVIIGSLGDTPRKSDSDVISVVLNALGPAKASQLTAPSVVGALLVISGGIIRVECFRTLGQFFTVQQCLRREHKLVTSGPYAVVRHPSYVALLMCISGSWIMYDSPGSWLRASGMSDMPWVSAAVAGWCLIMTASVVTLFRRTTEEDQFLAERFGKEWEAWARRVKYKFVPFVY